MHDQVAVLLSHRRIGRVVAVLPVLAGGEGKSVEAPADGVEAGDTLLLVSDGITEARCGKSFLGYNGMEEMARQAGTAPSLRGMGKAILEGAGAFAEGSLPDDACLLLARGR